MTTDPSLVLWYDPDRDFAPAPDYTPYYIAGAIIAAIALYYVTKR